MTCSSSPSVLLLPYVARSLSIRSLSFLLVVATLLSVFLFGVPVAAADTEVSPYSAAYYFVRGKLLSEQGSFEEARHAFERAIELDDSDPYSRLELAKLHAYLARISSPPVAAVAQLRAAAGHADVALRNAPDNHDVLEVYGRVHLGLAENEPASLALAQEAFETLREQERADIQTLTSLGQIYLFRQRNAQAADVLREAADLRPGNQMINSMLLEALLGGERLAEAAGVLAELVEIDPTSKQYRLALAELHNQRGRHRDAAKVLVASPEPLANDPDIRRELAAAYHQSGQNRLALELAERLDPTPDSIRLRVAALSALGRWHEALGMADQLELDGSLDARLRSRLLERAGQPAAAARMLEAELAPGDGDEATDDPLAVRIGLAGVYERDGDLTAAVRVLEGVPEDLAPADRATVVRALAGLYRRLDRLDDAMALYDRDIAVLEAAGQEDLAEHLALRKLTLLDEAEAYDLLESAANEAIDSGSEALRFAGHVGRSQALAGRGDLDAALETLGTAAQTAEDARRRELLARRIGLLFDAARDDEARRLIEPFTAADSADDLFFAAQAWYRAERWAEAIPLLERVIEAAPEAVTPYFTLGAALERNGEIDRAVSTFESLLERMPDHAPTLNYLGYLWVDRGENLERALALIETAVAIDPENGAYIDSLGWAHFRLGDLDDARRVLEWAGRLVVDDPTVFEHLGDVYVALGEITSARRAYQRALDLDSDDADRIRTKLADLEPNQDIR